MYAATYSIDSVGQTRKITWNTTAEAITIVIQPDAPNRPAAIGVISAAVAMPAALAANTIASLASPASTFAGSLK